MQESIFESCRLGGFCSRGLQHKLLQYSNAFASSAILLPTRSVAAATVVALGKSRFVFRDHLAVVRVCSITTLSRYSKIFTPSTAISLARRVVQHCSSQYNTRKLSRFFLFVLRSFWQVFLFAEMMMSVASTTFCVGNTTGYQQHTANSSV